MANGQTSGHLAAASTNPWTTRTSQRPDPCDDNCTPKCPACGGLKCSCRPRFFPGQLLTDRELNGLEQYVIDKNRLHNVYLHGWGVACGLEVVCDDCDPGHVLVRTGYAVSPCGDDIVVCSDQSVDVCALINSCEPRQPNCDDPYDTPPRDCTGGQKTWVIGICYDERPVRGITAQLGAGDSPSCGRCGCGGSGSCGCNGGSARGGCNGGCSSQAGGCGCGGSSARGPAASGRGYKPQCEPTQVCEGYRFVAYPTRGNSRTDVPTNVGDRSDYLWAWLYANRSKYGALIDRVLCCATKAMELRQSIREGQTLTGAAGLAVYTDYAQALAEFAADFAIHGCAFVAKTRQLRDDALAYRRLSAQQAPNAFTIIEFDLASRIRVLDETWIDIISECLCSALLPGCPTPPATNCVPLAVVTIDGDDSCRIVDICNWSERKILITWPTVTYWLSWLPWKRVWAWVQNLCCGSEGGPQAYQLLALMFGVIFGQGTPGTKGLPTGFMATAMAQEHAPVGEAKGPAGTPVPDDPLGAAFDADDFLAHMLGEVDRLAKDGPEATGQPAWMGVVARVLDGTLLAQRPVEDPKVAELNRRLDTAEKTLRSQATKLAALSKKGSK